MLRRTIIGCQAIEYPLKTVYLLDDQRRPAMRQLAEELYLGMREVADPFRTTIVGGDTNSWDGPLVVSVTVLGRAMGRGAVCRVGSGAKRSQRRPMIVA